MLEVDVDVGRLAALGRKEALEEQVAARRIDRRDAEAVADRAVGGAAPPLAEDVALARHLDDGVHAQEVRRDLEPGDERELLLDLLPDAVRQLARIARARAFVRQAAQRVVGGLPLHLP